MSLPLLACLAIAVLALGDMFYGRFVARQYRLDDGAVTPAAAVNDGVDFVPTRPFYWCGSAPSCRPCWCSGRRAGV